MAGQQLTPRQKMINMMYLVLTAILALNVSSEVLNAFKTVNDGIGTSNQAQASKNTAIFGDLSRQYGIDPARAKEAYEKAGKARMLSARLNALLEQYKQQLISEAGGIDKETGKIHSDDNINIATRIFVENNGQNGKALKKEIESTRSSFIALLPETDRPTAEKALPLKLQTTAAGWEYASFNEVPVVAAVTLLTKYQNDVLSAEGQIVERLYNSINTGITTVDQMEARVLSPSSYILQGEAYNADVMVAASNSTVMPDVYLGAFTSEVKRKGKAFEPIKRKSEALPLTNPVKVDVSGGLGRLSFTGAGVGKKNYTGVVRIKNTSNGSYEFYPFEGEYQVAPKTAVVSPKMMNVMYIGLDNMVDVSVPGVAQSEVTAVLNGAGTLSKSADGGYNARVQQPGTVKVEVKANVNGKTMAMGEQLFRVKRIPNPVATLDGLNSPLNCGVGFIKPRRGIVAKVENFEYPVQFKVLSFTGVLRKKDGSIIKSENSGPAFNDNIQSWTKNIQKGEAMFFDDIVVMGPDNVKRTINPLAFNIIMQ